MRITKSDYLLFKQCPKSFWYQKNRNDLMLQKDEVGHLEIKKEINNHARGLFPGGTVVPHSVDTDKMIRTTKDLIEKGETTIYEATFEFEGMLATCNIIKKVGDTWNVFNVTASTGVKDRLLDGTAFQFYAVANNLPVSMFSIVYVNNSYIRSGELNIQELFCVRDVSEEIINLLPNALNGIQEMQNLVLEPVPECGIGVHCSKYGKEDVECPAKKHCWDHVPECSVFDISRIGKKAFDLHNRNIIKIENVPNEFKLTEGQRFQVEALKEDKKFINKSEIQKHLTKFTYPLYFLDFETFQQAIPLFDNLKPYQHIPFQYSLHIVENENNSPQHKEFLAKEGMDPRRTLAEKLIADIPKGVVSVAYNMSFEKMVLKDLSDTFPELANHLIDIAENMVDLMVPFQKKWYYVNEMRGRHSIKFVLPALFPLDQSLDYTQLKIQNGTMAMNAYGRLHTFSSDEIADIRKELLAYCHLDTLAMVKIWFELKNEINK